MQFWNIMVILADFAMFRIPYTTLLTRFCATENPQALMRTIVFMYFWSTYVSQLFTVLFCGLRVALLFSATQKTTKKIATFMPPIIIICGLLAALPHFSTDSFCLQLVEPFVYGSILIISKFHSNNPYVVYINMYIYLSVTITITVLNLMMMYKVRQKKYLGFQRSVNQASKIERTLTGTMIILLFPMIVSLCISIGEINRIGSFSYILLIRPIFIDARVHIVTCYFYFTHPIFKKGSPQSSVSHMSRATL
uniref:Serpentine Receptor, class U n=1 Tax=Caenorhabditis tropicalis TaxID=1561998 RepID=A0A1I7SYB9_9PELO